jgi:hypothetical protein
LLVDTGGLAREFGHRGWVQAQGGACLYTSPGNRLRVDFVVEDELVVNSKA